MAVAIILCMCVQSQKISTRSNLVLVLLRNLIVSVLTVLGLPVLGDQSAVPSRPETINWVSGPAKANLGEYAEINVPTGYRFAVAEQARIFYRLMGKPVPTQIVGILAPASGKSLVTFEYADIGYIKDAGSDSLNPDAVLVTLRRKVQRQNEQMVTPSPASIPAVDWELQPKFDRNEHILEWANRVRNEAGTIVYQVVSLIGRGGVLKAITVQSRQDWTNSVPLRGLMDGVSYKEGYAYGNYRDGDKLASLGLVGLITAEAASEATSARSGKTSALTLGLIGGCTLVCAVAVVWVVKKGRRYWRMLETREFETRFSQPDTSVNENHGKQNCHRKQRRQRIFNYQKYYVDLFMKVSEQSYISGPRMRARNGASLESNHQIAPNRNSESRTDLPVQAANASVIEIQKNVIEELQHLIREQRNLIANRNGIQQKDQIMNRGQNSA